MISASATAQAGVHAREVENGVEYTRAGGQSLRMDLCLPKSATKTPAVIIVHGGAWVSGDRRTTVEPLFRPLTEGGFAWFSISYTLATGVSNFGAGISDVQQAIRFLKAHASDYNIDPDRIALIGESAGGQLAAIAALRGGSDVGVRAVVALYAPTDLVALAKNSNYIPPGIRDSIRGTPWERLILAGLGRLSPINNVRPNMPPFLFIHGTADSLVPFEQSRDMCARMKQAGASCEVYPVVGGGHGMLWWESSPRLSVAYKHKLVEWLRDQLSNNAVTS